MVTGTPCSRPIALAAHQRGLRALRRIHRLVRAPDSAKALTRGSSASMRCQQRLHVLDRGELLGADQFGDVRSPA